MVPAASWTGAALCLFMAVVVRSLLKLDEMQQDGIRMAVPWWSNMASWSGHLAAVIADITTGALMVCGAMQAWSKWRPNISLQEQATPQGNPAGNQTASLVNQNAKHGFLETIACLTGRGTQVSTSKCQLGTHSRHSMRDMLDTAMRMGQNGHKLSNMQAQKSRNSSVAVLWLCKEEEILHLHRILPASRFRILTAHKLPQLMDMLHQQPTLPDVLLMDLEGSWEEAKELLETVRSKYSSADLPIITILGVNSPNEADIKSLQSGANDSIKKPLQPTELDARILSQVHTHSQHVLRGEAATFLHILNRTIPGPIIQRTLARAQLSNSSTITIAQHLPEVTVLHVGIHNFTKLTTRWSTQHAVAVINEFMNPFDEILEKHGCFKAGQNGGTYTALAGHDGTPDHTVRMMAVARSMLAHSMSTSFCGERLQVSIGIHTGPVHYGLVGVLVPQFAVFGDTVNTAQSLQSVGPPGCAFLSGAAQQLLRERQSTPEFTCVDLGPCRLPDIGTISMFVAKMFEWESALRGVGAASLQSPPKSRSSTLDGHTSSLGPSRASKKIGSYSGSASKLRGPSYEEAAFDPLKPFELFNIPDLDEPSPSPSGPTSLHPRGSDIASSPYLPPPPYMGNMRRSSTVAGPNTGLTPPAASRSVRSLDNPVTTPALPSVEHRGRQTPTHNDRDSRSGAPAAGAVLETVQSDVNNPSIANKCLEQIVGLAGEEAKQLVHQPVSAVHSDAGAGSSNSSIAPQRQTLLNQGATIPGSIFKRDNSTNSSSLNRSGSGHEHTLGAHLLAHHSNSSGITLPMSSDSSLYRIPWLEQYLGSSTYIPTTSASHALLGNRYDSDDLLERRMGSPDTAPQHIMVYERTSTHTHPEGLSQPLEATSNNIMDSTINSSCVTSSHIAALQASLLASVRAASSQSSAAAIAQFSDAVLALAQGSSSDKLSSQSLFADLGLLNSLAAGPHPLITATDADAASARNTPAPTTVASMTGKANNSNSATGRGEATDALDTTSKAAGDRHRAVSDNILVGLLAALTPDQRATLGGWLRTAHTHLAAVPNQGQASTSNSSADTEGVLNDSSKHGAHETALAMASMTGLAHGDRTTCAIEDPVLAALTRNRASLTSDAQSLSMSFPQLNQPHDVGTAPLTGTFAGPGQSLDMDGDVPLNSESAGLMLVGLATLSNGQGSDLPMPPEMLRMLDAMRSRSESRSGQIPNAIQSLQQILTALGSVTVSNSNSLPISRRSVPGTPGQANGVSSGPGCIPSPRLTTSSCADILNEMTCAGEEQACRSRLKGRNKAKRQSVGSSASDKASDGTLPEVDTQSTSSGVKLDQLLASLHQQGLPRQVVLAGHSSCDSGSTAPTVNGDHVNMGKEAGFITQVVEKLGRKAKGKAATGEEVVAPRAKSAFNFREAGSKGGTSLKERYHQHAGLVAAVEELDPRNRSDGEHISAGVDDNLGRVRWSLTDQEAEGEASALEAPGRKDGVKRRSSFKKLASGLRKVFSTNSRSNPGAAAVADTLLQDRLT